MFDAHIYLDTGEVFVDKEGKDFMNIAKWLRKDSESWYSMDADGPSGPIPMLINVSHIAYIKLKPSEEE